MGGGFYNVSARTLRAEASYSAAKSATDIFAKSVNKEMDPIDISIRESRDSDDHPNSVSIILGLDVTGSMGKIPEDLIRVGLPTVMSQIIDGGVPDPQVLFVGVGDHECDRHPLQVGQFESSDDKLDHWLERLYLEGGGGGNRGESYFLPWYFAAYNTSIDCFEKRGKKGIIITIGDEPYLQTFSASGQRKIFGPKPQGAHEDLLAKDIFEAASRTYDIYHIHTNFTFGGRHYASMLGDWKALLGERFLEANSIDEIPVLIASTIVNHQKAENSVVSEVATETPTKTEKPALSEEVEDML